MVHVLDGDLVCLVHPQQLCRGGTASELPTGNEDNREGNLHTPTAGPRPSGATTQNKKSRRTEEVTEVLGAVAEVGLDGVHVHRRLLERVRVGLVVLLLLLALLRSSLLGCLRAAAAA